MKSSYRYVAIVQSIYDGDTIRADVDLGFFTWIRKEQFRLARIDTPEVRGDEYEAGIEARDYLRELILGEEVLLETEKKGKYGRYIAEVYAEVDDELININDHLVELGYAVYVDYN